MNCTVIGSGAWGTAMAIHLARNGHLTHLVSRRSEAGLALATERENREHLPGHLLHADIQAGSELRPALMEADVAFLACTSAGLDEACRGIAAVREDCWQLQGIVLLCKGLDRDTHKLPCEIAAEHLPEMWMGVLSGPSNASEVASGKPTALVLAGSDRGETMAAIQRATNGPTLRVYTSDDLRGVELGGCLKNAYAIGAGISDGLGLGDNAKGALVTRSLNEMVRLGTALGGHTETFFGLSGAGDLIATCHGPWSRNRRFGEAIGQAAGDPRALIEAQPSVVEGYWTTAAFRHWQRHYGIDAPILEEIYHVLYEGRPAREALRALMERNPKPERLNAKREPK